MMPDHLLGTDPTAPGQEWWIEREVAEREEGMSEVEGWLDERAASITRFLTTYQHARDLVGDVLEIGVYAGKYFLVLLDGLGERERAVAIDIFQSQNPKIPSAHGDRATFEATLKNYAPDARVVIMETDSTFLEPRDVLANMGELDTTEPPFRFISIDGSHEAGDVEHDLRLAADLLMPGGIIALDDWQAGERPSWPGVADGEAAFQSFNPGSLVHIGTIPNKLLLTNSTRWRDDYQLVLRDYARSLT